MKDQRQRITILIGEPAVGKSLIMREAIRVGRFSFHDRKWTPYYHSIDHRMLILGSGYNDVDQQFPGTDRLSMAVQPHAIDLMMERTFDVCFEGDRLGNSKMIDTLQALNFNVRLGVIRTDDKILTKRRKAERVQSETFLRSRRTKVANMVERHHGIVSFHTHNGPQDTTRVVKWLLADNPR